MNLLVGWDPAGNITDSKGFSWL